MFNDAAVAARLMRAHPFASLVTTDDEGFPFITHLPLHLQVRGDQRVLLGHCARGNPHWRYLQQRPEALVAFLGPHAYLSPAVYPDLQRVPSWNYLAVHCRVRAEMVEEPAAKDALLKALGSVIESKAVANALNAFSMAAILSSFIGVGLGVFDYLADLFKFDNSRQGRAKSWGVTFLPPLVFSLLFPFGFVVAIGYAGAAATVWACIIPALLAKKSRELAPQGGGFKAPGGQPMVVAVILFGVLTAIFHLMAMAGMLPIYTG